MRTFSRMLATSVVLSVLVLQCSCEAGVEKKELSPPGEVVPKSADLGLTSAPAVLDNNNRAPLVDQLPVTAVARGRAADSGEDDSGKHTDNDVLSNYFNKTSP